MQFPSPSPYLQFSHHRDNRPLPQRGKTMRTDGIPIPNLRLRAEREQRKWSRSYMAEKLDLGDPKTIGRWERGAALPSPHFRRKLCELFALSAEELGFVSPGVATCEVPPSHPALPMSQPQAIQKESTEREKKDWYVPYRRNPFFTGRQDVLTSLHTVFFSERLTTLSSIQALSGLGGIGKTHIAIEYAYRYRDQYAGIFWIQASTRDDLVVSCARLLDFLGHPLQEHQKDEDALGLFSHWLSRHTCWLLIMDNIEDLTLTQQVLPTDCQGHLLLTTRTQSTGSFARCIPLDQMTDSEGALFLLRRVKRLEPGATLVQSPPTDQFLGQRLSSLLGGLPLALDQAGLYIEETGCSISDYLQRYTHQRTQLLKRRGMAGREHPHSVTATFSLVYEQVKQKNPLASDLLYLCAFLHAEGIPDELFVAGTSPSVSPVFANLYQLDQAIALLRTFSLVQRHPETQTLSLHRLVQAVLQEEMDAEERAAWQQRVISLLDDVFPEVTYNVWDRCDRLLPHALAAAAFAEQAESEDLEHVLRKAADYLSLCAQYQQAESLYRHALRIQERLCGPVHEAVATSLERLAQLFKGRGKFEQAEFFCQRALQIREQ